MRSMPSAIPILGAMATRMADTGPPTRRLIRKDRAGWTLSVRVLPSSGVRILAGGGTRSLDRGHIASIRIILGAISGSIDESTSFVALERDCPGCLVAVPRSGGGVPGGG